MRNRLTKFLNRFAPAVVAVALFSSFALGVTLTGTNDVHQNEVLKAGFIRTSAIGGLTATAGGGQSNALLLTNALNVVTTVATAADSVLLPPCVSGLGPNTLGYGNTDGMSVVVVNAAAANSMNVFPQTGQSINALSANTALAVAAGKNATFFCAAGGIWYADVSA